MIDAIYIYENKQIKIVYNFSGEYEELMKNYNDGEYMKRNTGRDKDLKLVPVVGMETEKVSSYFINQEWSAAKNVDTRCDIIICIELEKHIYVW